MAQFGIGRRRGRDSGFMLLLGGALAAGAGIGTLVELPRTAPALETGVPLTAVSRQFGSCHTGGGIDCVVDGDTFWMDGEKIRIADIDAPETHPSRCMEEARLGSAATDRLQALLNAGPVELAIADRDTDRYGSKLRIVRRDGRSVGAMLVDEGLARPWEGHRRPWCDDEASV
ncbi:thermonuclease family protein [Sphingomonas sp. SUN039]|uniref:thermonuclease family protein n=1 Tax=Sphingomonas sp. SUN039 TaxID=2937787 RepID=UPI00216487B2|nr:thermonuclease family protein [Sphingomonas sp. SUN039]UVO55566.1 thermonuclease family protein [Sphingomonas sp. SUN039]